MRVAVVNVREICVSVSDGHMNVRMGVRLSAVPIEIVLMLMMRVVMMPMCVRQLLVRVRVFVTFPQM